jgi:hypothetical protein
MVFGLAIMAVILVSRNRRPRELNLQSLWVRPVLAVLFIGAMLYESPPPLTFASLAVMVAAVALGGALGWQRGRLTLLEVHPQTHIITARVSAVGVILVLGLIAARIILRNALSGPGFDGATVGLLADGLVVMAALTMLAQQVEISLRARRLLAQAQSALAGQSSAP